MLQAETVKSVPDCQRQGGAGRLYQVPRLGFAPFQADLVWVLQAEWDRAVQAILGHSDANQTRHRLTTDITSLQLHDEIAKLPWIPAGGIVAHSGAHFLGVSSPVVSLDDTLCQLQVLAQATGTNGLRNQMAPLGASGQVIAMAARAGIEPATK